MGGEYSAGDASPRAEEVAAYFDKALWYLHLNRVALSSRGLIVC
jgi:hypothetical protein